ncbi:hypothetical protein [Streptomyces ureilyticus]|uniref:Heavy metal-binding domain-containing protein n=1 Tax=Streptomyces ureilyticus TaxID=1775131 RepID=A0ABX0DLL3_9ACTN|nr:hypothetical protein [Streptomyces ureilyticus]NGO42678.1 hypothetical protein [Streptomyces ureilyticus]
MHTALKLTTFAAALAATFGTAYGVGNAIDPVVSDDDKTAEAAQHGGHAAGAEKGGGGGHGEGGEAAGGHAAELPGGLQTSEGGYTLDLKTSRIEAGAATELSFAIVKDSTGRNVTAYQREHEKELHLIVASRDLTVYRHLHPARAADGTWSIPVELPKAGGYRVFADFKPKGAAEGLTLGSDLAVSGPYKPAELPKPAPTAIVDDYKVTLNGELRPGAGSELQLNVTKDGKPVRNLQPYLGAYGHLVALRSGDLAYLHVHPNGEPGDGKTQPGPQVSFTATAPSKGAYRLFLDFKHEGKVRTAAFTVYAGGAPAAEPTTAEEHGSDGHGH